MEARIAAKIDKNNEMTKEALSMAKLNNEGFRTTRDEGGCKRGDNDGGH